MCWAQSLDWALGAMQCSAQLEEAGCWEGGCYQH